MVLLIIQPLVPVHGLSNGDIVDVYCKFDVGAVYFAVNGTMLGGASESEIQAGDNYKCGTNRR